jgi:hypothetical protein
MANKANKCSRSTRHGREEEFKCMPVWNVREGPLKSQGLLEGGRQLGSCFGDVGDCLLEAAIRDFVDSLRH